MNPLVTPEMDRQEVYAVRWTGTAPCVLSFALIRVYFRPFGFPSTQVLPNPESSEGFDTVSWSVHRSLLALLSVLLPQPIGLRMMQNTFVLITQPASNCHWLFCYPTHPHTSLHLPRGFLSCLVILRVDTGCRLLSGHSASASSVHTQPH